MENLFGDLHIHTVFSDGIFLPEEIVQESLKSGLHTISLTDHDTVDAYHSDSIKNSSIDIIPGIELSADYLTQRGSLREVHVLAYFIDVFHPKLQEYLQDYQVMRYKRAQRMIALLNDMNIPVTMSDLEKKVQKNIYGRLHVARVLIEKGYARTLREVFQNYIGDTCPAYVPKEQKKFQDMINLIHTCNGLAVIAHPGIQGLEKELPDMKRQELDGVEVFHPDHSSSLIQKLLTAANDLSLLITGGSDYHGKTKENLHLGDNKLPYAYIQQLKEAHHARIS